MEQASLLHNLFSGLKPVLSGFLETVVFTEIKKMEDQIGQEQVKSLVEKVTQAAESFIQDEIEKL